MSLERKDVRFRLAPEVHQALTVLAECAQVDIGEFCEMLVQREVVRRVHEASLIHERTVRCGLSGSAPDSPGFGGNWRDRQGGKA